VAKPSPEPSASPELPPLTRADELRIASRTTAFRVASAIVVVELTVFGILGGLEVSKVSVPDIMGADLATALQMLDDADLQANWSPDIAISPDELESYVVSEQGTQSTRVLRGTIVGFSLEVKVPDLDGLSPSAALEALDDLHLRGELPDLGLPDNVREHFHVIAQSPGPDELLPVGREVDFDVSPDIVVVPDLVGSSFGIAEDRLNESGLLAEALDAYSVPDGLMASAEEIEALFRRHSDWLVVGQSVAFEEERSAGSPVELALQVPAVVVPALGGMTQEQATSALVDIGLDLATPAATPDSWTTVTQNPAAGSLVLPESKVAIELRAPQIVFTVTGNGSRAMVTWAPPGSFSISQETNAALPWSRSFDDHGYGAYERGNFNAQSLNGNSITCTITANGVVVSQNTSTGPYAVVSCG